MEGERARAQGPYAAEVKVNGQGAPERNNAFVRALVQVLTRLSGDNAVASRPGMRQELARAKDMVAGYDYRQDEGVSARGAPTFGTVLVVRFEQDEVEELAALVGLPIWPLPRPKPVMWLAIDDGSGPRLAGLPQANAEQTPEGEVLRRVTFNPVARPTLRLTPQTGAWDWSQSGMMTLRLQSAMDWAVTVYVQIQSNDGRTLVSRVDLPAGPAQTVMIPLKARSPLSQGMRAGPPMP